MPGTFVEGPGKMSADAKDAPLSEIKTASEVAEAKEEAAPFLEGRSCVPKPKAEEKSGEETESAEEIAEDISDFEGYFDQCTKFTEGTGVPIPPSPMR